MRMILCLCLPLVFAGCSDSGDDGDNEDVLNPDVAPVTDGIWYRPKPMVTWQWQLSGTVNTTYNVQIYDIDLFDTSTQQIQSLRDAGKKVICYFSAGSYEEWRTDAAQFDQDDLGKSLDGWPGERWLDIRSENVHQIMRARLDLAQQKGCDGVEPDNMDGYANDSGFSLSARQQKAYNRFIANEAHTRSLSVGLKNDLDQIVELVDYYDFSVNEECFAYSECDLLTPFIEKDKAVLNAEYAQVYVSDHQSLCTQANQLKFSTLVLPLELDDGFRISCL